MIARSLSLAASLVLISAGTARADAAPAPAATATATPPAATAAASVEKPKAPAFPLHASAGVTNSLGSGTFVINPSNPTLQSLLSLGGTANLGDFSLNLSERIGFEWTNSDGDTYNHQLELSDPRIGVGYNAWKDKDLGLSVSLSGGYSLPFSLSSRQIGSLGALGVSGRGGYSNEALGLSGYASLSAGYTPLVPGLAQRFAAEPGRSYLDRTLGDTVTKACNPRSGSELDSYVCLDGGIPTVARWGIGIGGAYTLPFLDKQLTAALDLSYSQGFSAFVPTPGSTNLADYTNTNLTGAHAVNGLVPRQSTIGSLGVTYSPVEWFALTGGIFSAQPLLTTDGKGVRFPLWDFVSPYNNFSSFFVDTTFQI